MPPTPIKFGVCCANALLENDTFCRETKEIAPANDEEKFESTVVGDSNFYMAPDFCPLTRIPSLYK